MRKLSLSVLSLISAACLLWLNPPARAQSGAKNGEWRTYGGDLGNTRYSPLDQINAAQLQQARSRLALQDRQPRPAPRVSISKARR